MDCCGRKFTQKSVVLFAVARPVLNAERDDDVGWLRLVRL
jgi:hypothetical protein